MKRNILFLLFIMPLFGYADDLSDLLSSVYKPQLLTVEKQDSILNSVTEGVDQTTSARWRLEYENKQPLYRRSFLADYYVVDSKNGSRTQIGGGPIRDAVMSPNGRYIVYAKQNNLYIYKLDYMTEVAITTNNGERTMVGGNGTYKEQFIYNGIADWLYEEEFGVTAMFSFSPDSKQIAFVRLTENDIPSFTWQEMLDKSYPVNHNIRYPKAGERNAKASVWVYDIYTKNTHQVELNDISDNYIPRLSWMKGNDDPKHPLESKLLVLKLNRDQNQMEVIAVNPKSTAFWTIYRERSDRFYIDYTLFDQWYWLSDGRFVALSEKNGWSSVYLHNAQGQEIKQLTPGGMDVTRIYGVDEKSGTLYFQAAPKATVRQAYACDIKKGAIRQLTTNDGIHAMRFSKDFLHVIDNYESYDMPNQYMLYEIKKGELRVVDELQNNDTLLAMWQQSGLPNKRFLSVPGSGDDSLNAWMILPPALTDSNNNIVASDTVKYPCVLFQYSGPGSQEVLNRWRRGYAHYLASQGYVVINSDGRGTGCRGREWRNAGYMNLGEIEANDQIATAKYAASLSFVDPQRIAIIGWSYGGYQAIRTLCEGGEYIKCAVAIAPVTDWRLYDSGYTERYMRRPQVNDKGYDAADLSNMADHMNGQLLLIHGLADDNVHAQHTWKLTDALVQAGKQFEMQIYPDDNHFLRKRSNYEHLHRRILLFLQTHL